MSNALTESFTIETAITGYFAAQRRDRANGVYNNGNAFAAVWVAVGKDRRLADLVVARVTAMRLASQRVKEI